LTKTAEDSIKISLDDAFKGKILGNTSWVIRIVPLCDLRDVALGYVIGETMDKHSLLFELEHNREQTPEDFEKLIMAFKEKLPNIVQGL
jgi:hypothetical protein